jgi:outer membrane lipoprotein-sorting protein
MKPSKILAVKLACAILVTFLTVWTAAGAASASDQPDLPTVNANIGSCRADFTVKDGSGKPLYNAKINITIKYGFMNLHKAELEAPTNTNGQARFTGLPDFSKKPLKFVISSGTVSKTVTDDPATNCNAKFDVTLSVH